MEEQHRPGRSLPCTCSARSKKWAVREHLGPNLVCLGQDSCFDDSGAAVISQVLGAPRAQWCAVATILCASQGACLAAAFSSRYTLLLHNSVTVLAAWPLQFALVALSRQL